MRIWNAIALAVLTVGGSASSNTYRVRNTNNSGRYSLRWAIGRANAHDGPDTITFASALSGGIIRPRTPLPALTDERTIINGELLADGVPRIVLDGKRQSAGSGLVIKANACKVIGLVIRRFLLKGIDLAGASRCTVRTCYLGTNARGTTPIGTFGRAAIYLLRSHYNTIGGTSATHRNVIAMGEPPSSSGYGIVMEDSRHNTISGNYLGITANGSGTFSTAGTGISMTGASRPCSGNTIGGDTPSERNLFGGLSSGMHLHNADSNTVVGNTFGLGANGSKPLPIDGVGIVLQFGSEDNIIGGTTAAKRNVFANMHTGIALHTTTTRDNQVRGNWFGLNRQGTAERPIETGIYFSSECGPQTVGGKTAEAGNTFACATGMLRYGVNCWSTVSGTLIRYNKFGVHAGGGSTGDITMAGISVSNIVVDIRDNEFANSHIGVLVNGASANPRVFGNHFRRCHTAVHIGSAARCRLGNLGNTPTSDDGGNRFRPTNTWHVYNETPNLIKAEGNRFFTTSKAQINAKIFDRQDNGASGKVDFIPLMGGVMPTGDSHSVLAVTSLSAVPAPAGARITFSLSSAAQVQACILNIAGRPVKTLCQAKDCEAGTNTVLWNAQSDSGLAVPNGTYLVEVTAKAADGAQARGLSQVRVSR